jgi:hypothetical protein
MGDADRVSDDHAVVAKSEAEMTLEQKTSELLEFRDAGIISEAELEEQMTKLRWGIP